MSSSMSSLVYAVALAAQCPRSLGSAFWPTDELPLFGSERPQSAFDGPVIVNIGPVVDPVDAMLVPRGFTGFPIEEFVGESPFAPGPQGFEDLSMLLGGFRGMEDVINGDKFHTETKDGHFKLRASLPGFNIQSDEDGAPQVEQPLSVEIVGRSLVVRGQKSDEQSMTSFQRSFQLPRAADADKISVTYSKSDGALAVDVPASADMPENVQEADDGEWMFNSLEDGSHTSITFSSGGAPQMRPALRGGRRREPIEDPFFQLMEMLADTAERHSESKGDAPIIEMLPVEDSPVDLEDSPVALMKRMLLRADEGSREPPAAPLPEPERMPAATVAPTGKPAYMAQPKNSWPFWRLGDDSSVVEIVAPAGTDLGKPEGNRVPIHTSGESFAQGDRPVVGHVDLPVSVLDKNCSWASELRSQERVLRCRMENDVVKRVSIKEAEEL